MTLFFQIVATVTGMVVGSFLNVVIWRLPRGEALSVPRSKCPGCGRAIAWYDNVPVVSWVLLRGRCRGCGMPIALRYPLVEALTGVAFLATWWIWGGHLPTAVVVALAMACLIAISFIDWDHKIIPDRITKPGIVLAIAVAPITVLHSSDWLGALKPALNEWAHAAAGAIVGGGIILLVRWLGGIVLKKEAMGLGDVKLLAFIGALTGPRDVVYVLILACLSGVVIGIGRLWLAKGRPSRFPLEIRGAGEPVLLDRARITPEGLLVDVDRAAPDADTRLRLKAVLPAAGILEDDDAHVEWTAHVAGSVPAGGAHRWTLALEEPDPVDQERLALFAEAYRYIPFGPFLALGGALVLLFGRDVHWWITEGYPRWVSGLFGGR